MRALAALVLVAACATVGAGVSPAERVRGCWIERDDAGGAVTMRWLPDPQRPRVLRGEKLGYGPGGAVHNESYRLEPRGEVREAAWALCRTSPGPEQCWAVAQGEGGSLEGGRAFIDGHQERLRISIIGDGPDRVVYEGNRDGCD